MKIGRLIYHGLKISDVVIPLIEVGTINLPDNIFILIFLQNRRLK